MSSVVEIAAPAATDHVGRRVAYWRGRRRLSQQVFADRMGKSKSWVDKTERGLRRLDKFSVLYEIAEVLSIDVALLLGKEPAERGAVVSSGVSSDDLEALRGSLERYVAVAGYFQARLNPPALHDLRKVVTHARLTFEHARYDLLVKALPRLLVDAQTADTVYRNAPGEEAAGLLSQVYQVTSDLLRKLGQHDLAWLTADRAAERSMRAADPYLVGVAASVMGSALLGLGRPRSAMEVAVTIAQRIPPQAKSDPVRLSVYGTLLLRAATAAARLGDTFTVRELIAGAQDAATLLGADRNEYHTGFGPTAVELHRVLAAVELGEGKHAIALHERINGKALRGQVPERHGHHLLTVARAHAHLGEMDNAAALMLAADGIAPQEVRSRPLARELMGDVLRLARGGPPPRIVELAGRMGVAA
ncbi:helix-turn-helix domain-containing protein [Micromonospora sp. NPDC004704]